MGWGTPFGPSADEAKDAQAPSEPQPTNQDGSPIPTPAAFAPAPLRAWLDEQKTPEEWAATPATDVNGELIEEPVTDVFALNVTYSYEVDAAHEAPTFDTYDEARGVGVELLLSGAATSFSVSKSTVLK